jgi:hypothetical protein
MVFRNFRGDQGELCFLKFFLERAQMLTKLVIVYGKGCFTSMTEADSVVKPLFNQNGPVTVVHCCSLKVHLLKMNSMKCLPSKEDQTFL